MKKFSDAQFYLIEAPPHIVTLGRAPLDMYFRFVRNPCSLITLFDFFTMCKHS